MKDIYFISGLGADERLFRQLKLGDGCRPRYVKWIPPAKQESWESYAKRLSEQITTPDPVIIGMSMGGMMAIEISKLIHTGQVILISSAKTGLEIPPYFKILRWTRVHRWLPYGLLKFFGVLLGGWLFGTRGIAEKELLKSIIQDTDETFFRWAWEKVIRWQNEFIPPAISHIHGDRDYMLPLRYIRRPDQVIKGGTHFMVVHDADEVSALLNQLIGSQ